MGIAPDKLVCHENGEIKTIDPIDRLKSVKGHLVSFPLEFMREEDLRPAVMESEFYVAPQVYHWVCHAKRELPIASRVLL